MRYRPANPYGAIAACVLCLIATCGAIISPDRHVVSWILIFAASGILFLVSVEPQRPLGGE